LGKTIVSQFYGQAAADSAAAEFDKVFAQKQLPDDMPEIGLPSEPISVKQLLLACRLVETGGEAKRMCAQSAVTIDGSRVADPNAQITPTNGMTIQVGKRKFARVRVNT
jgi:tyrosyl-tRNA synthetase